MYLQIFGLVLVVLFFRIVKEVFVIFNNIIYGFGGSVWIENVFLVLEVVLGIKAGIVWINCYNLFDVVVGFGGYKQSGYGRDGGKEVCGKCFDLKLGLVCVYCYKFLYV